MKFFTKLLILTLFIAVLAVTSIAYFGYITTTATFKEEIKDKMEEQAYAAMDKVDRMLFERMADIKAIANDPVLALRSSTPEQITKRLIEYRDKHPDYVSLSFFDLDRVRIADTAGVDLGIKRKRIGRHWEDVLSDKVSIATDIAISEALHIPVIFFAALVKDRAGEKIGVVVSRIPVNVLYEITEQAAGIHEQEIKARVDLISKDGLLIYSNYNKKGILTQSLKDWRPFKESVGRIAQKVGVFIEEYSESKEKEFYVFAVEQGYLDFKGNDWILLMHVPLREIFSPIAKFKYRVLFILVPVILISLMIILIFSRSVSKSLVKLRDAAAEVGKGNMDIKIATDSKGEIGDLSRSFKKMTQDLKKSRDDFLREKSHTESIIASMIDNLVVIDLDCKIKLVNRELLNLLGYEEDELIGQPAQKIFSGMYEAEAEVEKILNEINIGALLVSKDLKILTANRALEEMLGLDKKDIINKPCYKVAHGRETVCEPIYTACPIRKESEREKPCIEVHEHIDKTGKPMFVNVTAAPIIDSYGQILYYLHLTRRLPGWEAGRRAEDLDSEMASELVGRLKVFIEKLEKTHIFCAFGIRRIIHAGLVRDVEMEFMTKKGEKIEVSFSVSPIFEQPGEKTTDKELTKIIGVVGIARDMRPMKKLINDLERAKLTLQEWSKTLEAKVEERTRDLSKSQEASLNILEDLIEAKDNLIKYSKQLEEALSIKSRFTSMVSHELRTPLTAIKEGLGIVLDGSAGNLNNEQKEFLDISKRNVDRLARLINAVLDFQKMEAGKYEFNMQENDINEVIAEAAKTMVQLVKEKKLNFEVKLDDSLPKIKFDKDKIIEVIINLLSNAIKFTEAGGIVIASVKDAENIRVSVKDTGIGIKEADMPRLFKSFEQLGKDNERKTAGTGLGLVISKGIIEKHNGMMWAESVIKKGSTFYFTLPLK